MGRRHCQSLGYLLSEDPRRTPNQESGVLLRVEKTWPQESMMNLTWGHVASSHDGSKDQLGIIHAKHLTQHLTGSCPLLVRRLEKQAQGRGTAPHCLFHSWHHTQC